MGNHFFVVFAVLDVLFAVNSPFAHQNLFNRMHMGVRNDPSLGPLFCNSFCNRKTTENRAYAQFV